MGMSAQSLHIYWLYQRVESYIHVQLAISEGQVVYTTGYIRESSRIYDWLYQSRNRGFSNFTYVIVTVYFTTFESVIVSRNHRRPCYVSKKAYSCRVREF